MSLTTEEKIEGVWVIIFPEVKEDGGEIKIRESQRKSDSEVQEAMQAKS